MFVCVCMHAWQLEFTVLMAKKKTKISLAEAVGCMAEAVR